MSTKLVDAISIESQGARSIYTMTMQRKGIAYIPRAIVQRNWCIYREFWENYDQITKLIGANGALYCCNMANSLVYRQSPQLQ